MNSTNQEIFALLQATQGKLNESSVPTKLRHLLVLRGSQINGCGFCVKMHTTEARAAGETNERLDGLIVWRQVPGFSPAECAALEWTEALTRLPDGTDWKRLRSRLDEHFTPDEVTALTGLVAMINLWNRIQISSH